jgi:hypothetical protein
MKKWVITAILAPAVFASVLPVVVYKWQPCLVFKTPRHHYYGRVDEGSTVVHSFIIKNTGLKALRLKSLKASCGCSKAEAEKLVLRCGETCKITLKYKAQSRLKDTITLLLTTNDPRKPHSRLTMTCRIRLAVFWYPKSISIYTDADTQPVPKEIRFLVGEQDRVQLSGLRASSDRITVDQEGMESGVKCVVRLDPRCPLGTWQDHILLTAKTADREKQISIPVHIMKR